MTVINYRGQPWQSSTPTRAHVLQGQPTSHCGRTGTESLIKTNQITHTSKEPQKNPQPRLKGVIAFKVARPISGLLSLGFPPLHKLSKVSLMQASRSQLRQQSRLQEHKLATAKQRRARLHDGFFVHLAVEFYVPKWQRIICCLLTEI